MLKSIRSRIVFWNAVVLSVCLLMTGLVIHAGVRANLIGEANDELLSMARHGAGVGEMFLGEDAASAGRSAELLHRFASANDSPHMSGMANPDAISLRVFRADGSELFPGRVSGDAALDRDGLRAAFAGRQNFRSVQVSGADYQVLSYPSMKGGSVRLVVQASRLTESIDRAIQHLDKALLHLIPFALILASLGGWALAAVGLRPIRKMAMAASEIDAAGLGRRLPIHGKDEVAELAAAFNQLLERLEESFESQRRFVADASHELRTPLTVLKANTSLALSGLPVLEEYALSLRNADSAADRMARLVDELLFLSRADAGQASLTSYHDDLASVVRESVESFRRQAEAAEVELRLYEHPQSQALSNHGLIERLISNLVTNALRHTPTGGAIVVEIVPDGDQVRLSVTDTGSGIATEHLPHLFERFYRVGTDRSRTAGGVGLGLAICRSIAESLGGSISIQSTVGVGTQAEVLLPNRKQGSTTYGRDASKTSINTAAPS